MSRIAGEKVALNKAEVAEFFEQRAHKFSAATPLTAILYQDKHPEIAQRRDALERERVMPLLALTGAERVLDVGCGIGRWGAAVADRVAVYHGIDASPSLIDLARSYCRRDNTVFHAAGVDDLTDGWLGANGPFDRVICSGILIYLDDQQVASLLARLSRQLAAGAIVYVREPMALKDRLTLSSEWSEELQACYSAIYRTPKEIDVALTKAFPSPAHEVGAARLLFEQADLNNRAETQQHFCIVKKSR
jgi:2-polyprenyl-3-methyl-5-hydroxy-6-metoxy-1,4-benzoquinol methylase